MKDEEFFRKIDSNCYDPEIRIKEMDKAGIKIFNKEIIIPDRIKL